MTEKIQKDNQVESLLETINSNFLTLMSMCVGITCRLNSQETLLREIIGKLNGNTASGGRNDDQSEEEQQGSESKEEIGDENTGDGFNLLDHLMTTMGSPKTISNEGESIAESDDKGKLKNFYWIFNFFISVHFSYRM